MVVIPINFSPDVEIHIKGMKRGNRSQWVDRVIKAEIQRKLKDDDQLKLIECSHVKLIVHGCARALKNNTKNLSPDERRMIELRNMLLDHLATMIPKDL